MISKSYYNKQKNNIMQLYKSLVWSNLECESQAWQPYKQKYINPMGSVQKRATKMVEVLHEMSNKNRFSTCGMIPLEMRKRRVDLIEIFGMMNGVEPLPVDNFFLTILSTMSLPRWYSYKNVNLWHGWISIKIFSHRVVDSWNSLSIVFEFLTFHCVFMQWVVAFDAKSFAFGDIELPFLLFDPRLSLIYVILQFL